MPVVQSALRKLEEGTYNTDEGALLWWNYYDTNTLAVASQTYNFFAVPKGGGGPPPKDLAQTNFPAANQMPQAQNLEIKAFELFYIPSAAKTQAQYQLVLDSLRNAWFEFNIFNSAASVQIPLTQFFGATMPLVVTGGAVGDQAFGRAQYNGTWETPVEIVLAAKANFECKIEFNAAVDASLADDRLQLSMVGGLVRLNS